MTLTNTLTSRLIERKKKTQFETKLDPTVKYFSHHNFVIGFSSSN